jgi:serine/threonine protein kinase
MTSYCHLQIRRLDNTEIWECMDRSSGTRYCVKMLQYGASSELEAAARREADYLKRAQGCSSVVELIEVMDENDTIHMIMEYCSGGSLSTHVLERGGYTEDQLKELVHTFLCGIRHLHRIHICHNDIQPCNVLLAADGKWKIADFGKASRAGFQLSDELQSPYFAPELSQGGVCSLASDMWSVGALLIFCILGRTPSVSTSSMTTGTKLVFLRSEWGKISKLAKHLIVQCLHLDPTERLSSAELLDHEWFQPISKGTKSRRERFDSLTQKIVKRKSFKDFMSPYVQGSRKEPCR